MTTAIELWDKLRQQPHSWIPDGKVFAFILTDNERETVLNALLGTSRPEAVPIVLKEVTVPCLHCGMATTVKITQDTHAPQPSDS